MDWLRRYNPRIDWQHECLYVNRTKAAQRELCIPSLAADPSAKASGSGPPEYLISRMQLKRILKKPSSMAYLIYIKKQAVGTADASGEQEQPARLAQTAQLVRRQLRLRRQQLRIRDTSNSTGIC